MKHRSDLHVGRAGEYLVAADLLRRGHDCSFASQGMPYDIVADIDGRLSRIQVKTTRRPERMPGRLVDRYCYRFWVHRCGKGGKGNYADGDVDLFAFVGLEGSEIGYCHASKSVRTLFIRPERLRGTFCDEILAARNTEIRAQLNAGLSTKDACERFGLKSDMMQKIKHGRARSHIPTGYMSDFSLEKAIAGLSTS